jgi:lysophospholipase L1-like esterase
MATPPRVLLLGDSIRMQYQPNVKATLESTGEAEVVGPAENCQFAEFTLENIDRWIEELGTPDIVHWNNGLHDVGHNPSRDPVQFPVDRYTANLEGILAKLRATGASVIWATLTPIDPDRPFQTDTWGWKVDDIATFNTAALGVMNAAGVPVNDLHKVVLSDYKTLLSEDMLHLSPDGCETLGAAVVEAVRKQLVLR